MKEIQLTKGYTALVDDLDYEWLNGFNWHTLVNRRKNGTIKNVYAVRKTVKENGKRESQLMHCLIMGTKGIDHEDHNSLNNQRYNLRPATGSQNNYNSRLRMDSTSGYKGVSWDKTRNKWFVSVQIEGKQFNLGRFIDILDAIKVADAARLKYHGEFALTNAVMATKGGAL